MLTEAPFSSQCAFVRGVFAIPQRISKSIGKNLDIGSVDGGGLNDEGYGA